MPDSTFSDIPSRRRRRVAAVTAGSVVLALAGCGTTGHYVDKPQLTFDGGRADARDAVAQLFGPDVPYTVRLCAADPSTKDCKTGAPGLSATGVGGLFFPLLLRVNGMRVRQQRPSPDGLAIEAALSSRADGIAPLCTTAHAAVVSRDDNTASIRIRNLYCNWLAVGNVIASLDLSIDRIDLKDKTFTGYYKLTFHGTGNVSGSGYYKAVITPKAA